MAYTKQRYTTPVINYPDSSISILNINYNISTYFLYPGYVWANPSAAKTR